MRLSWAGGSAVSGGGSGGSAVSGGGSGDCRFDTALLLIEPF